jgi:hypothetical protein
LKLLLLPLHVVAVLAKSSLMADTFLKLDLVVLAVAKLSLTLDTLVLPAEAAVQLVDKVLCEHSSPSFAACSVAADAVVQPKLLAADALAVDATKHCLTRKC